MRHETNEISFQLCQLSAIEQDPAKVLALVTEINRMSEEKEERLKRQGCTLKKRPVLRRVRRML